jgi:hypothetical protein
MANQRMIVTDDTILIDFRLVFKAIKEEKGNWKKVEQEMEVYFESLTSDSD